MNTQTKTLNWRVLVLLLITLASLLFIFSKPIATQDPNYHNFADQRPILGINNSFDVLSNLPFLLVGILGILKLSTLRNKLSSYMSWLTFFVGVLLVAPGSAYYHYAPTNQTLVWDRLPMTISFMGLFVALLTESVSQFFSRTLFFFIALGFFSVGVWDYTGDLRLYYWVQAFPLFCIPIILTLFPVQFSGRIWLFVGLAFYILAKVTEFNDEAIFKFLGEQISGHSLKHLLAACGPLAILQMLLTRKPVELHNS